MSCSYRCGLFYGCTIFFKFMFSLLKIFHILNQGKEKRHMISSVRDIYSIHNQLQPIQHKNRPSFLSSKTPRLGSKIPSHSPPRVNRYTSHTFGPFAGHRRERGERVESLVLRRPLTNTADRVGGGKHSVWFSDGVFRLQLDETWGKSVTC